MGGHIPSQVCKGKQYLTFFFVFFLKEITANVLLFTLHSPNCNYSGSQSCPFIKFGILSKRRIRKNSLQLQLGVHAAQRELSQARWRPSCNSYVPSCIAEGEAGYHFEWFFQQIASVAQQRLNWSVLDQRGKQKKYWWKPPAVYPAPAVRHQFCFLSFSLSIRTCNEHVCSSLPVLSASPRESTTSSDQTTTQHCIAFPYEELFPVLLWKCTCVKCKGHVVKICGVGGLN